MYKFGFNFLQLHFSKIASCTGQGEIVTGQSGLNKKRRRYNQFYFLKSTDTHNLLITDTQFYPKIYYTKKVV